MPYDIIDKLKEELYAYSILVGKNFYNEVSIENIPDREKRKTAQSELEKIVREGAEWEQEHAKDALKEGLDMRKKIDEPYTLYEKIKVLSMVSSVAVGTSILVRSLVEYFMSR